MFKEINIMLNEKIIKKDEEITTMLDKRGNN